MGGLVDKLERSSGGATQPLGFTKIGTREKVAPLLMMGRIDVKMEVEAKNILSLGLDGIIITVDEPTKAQVLNRLTKTLGKSIWGTWVNLIGGPKPKGCDFQVFSSDATPIAFLGNEEHTTLMEIDSDMDDSLLRTIEDLPVDGFLLSLTTQPKLTIKQLISIARVRSVTSKWIMLHMIDLPEIEDLPHLRDAGVNAVVLEVTKHPSPSIKKVLTAALDLPRPSNEKRRDKSSPTVPTLGINRETSHTHEEEEDDFDDDID
jgi:hypothetical protein